MLKRAITGFFFIAIVIACIAFGKYSFWLIFSILGIGSLVEFFSMIRQLKEVNPMKTSCMIIAVGSFVLTGMYFEYMIDSKYFSLLIPAIVVLFVLPLYRRKPLPLNDMAYSIFGLIYTTVPFLLFIALAFVNGTYQWQIPFGFLIILWSNDTGAYLAGRAIGKRKLFERISPKKTWEGFFGGVFLGLVAAGILSYFFHQNSIFEWCIVSLLISCFATLGDLIESLMKRTLLVKDSGKLLPGHGGLLDRFDGFILSAPMVYFVLSIL